MFKLLALWIHFSFFGVVPLNEAHIYVPDYHEPTAEITARWRDNLKNNAATLFNRLALAVPDEVAFGSKIAVPAANAFAGFINPAFTSIKGETADDITFKHRKNIEASYGKFFQKITASSATKDGVTAASFKAQVDGGEDNFAVGAGMKILRAVGDRISGRGAAIIIAGFLAGDQKATSYFRPGDTLDIGIPLKMSPATVPISETRQIVLTGISRSIMKIINSNFDATTITAQNTALVATFNLLLNAALYEPFLVAGVLGTNSLITPSYSVELGFNWHVSLTAVIP